MSQQKCPLFLLAPLRFRLDKRVQIVMPTLTTLLPTTAAQLLGNVSPILRSTFLDKLQYDPVFLRCPHPLDLKRKTFLVQLYIIRQTELDHFTLRDIFTLP